MGVGDKTLAEFIINLAGHFSRVRGQERRGVDAGERVREQAVEVCACTRVHVRKLVVCVRAWVGAVCACVRGCACGTH